MASLAPLLWLRRKLFRTASSSAAIKLPEPSQQSLAQIFSPEPELKPSQPAPALSAKQLINELTSDTNLPREQVAMVVNSCLEQFVKLVNEQSNLNSPVLKFTAFTTPAKPASEGKPAQPELKFFRITIKPSKPAETASN
jgi:hypothetical protein